MVVVAGDVNSTIACALVAAKERIPVAHAEAGLRSFDRSMPEEINRVLTDAVADLLFTTEESANQNLANEGIATGKVFFVGEFDDRFSGERSQGCLAIFPALGTGVGWKTLRRAHAASSIERG